MIQYFCMDEKTKEIISILSKKFPSPESELTYGNVFQLLAAVILSAQCTDKRVNMVTKTLFPLAGTPEKMAAMPIEKLEEIIHPCGFYKTKSKFLHNMAKDILGRFGGEVPRELDDLRSLDGVGRKTANVVYAVGFGGQAIAVDTHVFRVANRLGLADAKTPEKTEEQLTAAIDKNLWRDSHHYLLLFGRYFCTARNPKCAECELKHLCVYYKTFILPKNG